VVLASPAGSYRLSCQLAAAGGDAHRRPARAVALGAVAGARRTLSAYGRYLTSTNVSDAVALVVLGGIAALALLVFAGQGLAQLLGRSGPDIAVVRALGGTRAQSAVAVSLPGAVAILGGMVLAVAGAGGPEVSQPSPPQAIGGRAGRGVGRPAGIGRRGKPERAGAWLRWATSPLAR
jgi:hypothetical protein